MTFPDLWCFHHMSRVTPTCHCISCHCTVWTHSQSQPQCQVGGCSVHTHTNPLHPGPSVGKVSKSYQEVDHVKEYCLANSTAPHPVQQALMQETLKLSNVSTLLCNETFNIVTLFFNNVALLFNILTLFFNNVTLSFNIVTLFLSMYFCLLTL